MKFKSNAKIESDDILYDIFYGGGINPSELLESKMDAINVEVSIEILRTFIEEMRNNEVLEEF